MYTLSCHVEFSFSYHDWARPAVLQFFISIFIITDQMDSSARALSLYLLPLHVLCLALVWEMPKGAVGLENIALHKVFCSPFNICPHIM